MENFIKPDWTRSNINISATLAEFLGAPNKNKTLDIVKHDLGKNYKNIVFLCLDGLGINPININLSEGDFLRRNIKQILLSTFPSTTTNATNSLMMNKLPLEHGWFGWSLYFENEKQCVDIFLNRNSWTGDSVSVQNSPLAPIDYYFDHANSEYEINSIFPPYVKVNNEKQNIQILNEKDLCDAIKYVTEKPGKQFVYAYFDEPDSTMHEFGVSSHEAKEKISLINNCIENLCNDCDDTLFLITADHGQIDIDGYILLYEDKELMSMLKVHPFLESRAPAFLVSQGKHSEFENYFNKHYGDDFVLMKSKEMVDQGYFGRFGDKAHLLGDYIAISKNNKQAVLTPNSTKFKGHHTSLTAEMEVPLIIFGKK